MAGVGEVRFGDDGLKGVVKARGREKAHVSVFQAGVEAPSSVARSVGPEDFTADDGSRLLFDEATAVGMPAFVRMPDSSVAFDHGFHFVEDRCAVRCRDGDGGGGVAGEQGEAEGVLVSGNIYAGQDRVGFPGLEVQSPAEVGEQVSHQVWGWERLVWRQGVEMAAWADIGIGRQERLQESDLAIATATGDDAAEIPLAGVDADLGRRGGRCFQAAAHELGQDMEKASWLTLFEGVGR